MTSLKTLQESMCNKEGEESCSNFEEFQKNKNLLKKDSRIFTKESKNTSQICHYFEHFSHMKPLLKQLIAADDWESHLQTVQSILLNFSEFDNINFLRYESVYLEQMRRLPQDYPEICDKYMNGLFAVVKFEI